MTRYTPQWLQAGSYAASIDRRLISALWPSGASTGGAVTVSSGMTVNAAPGQVAVPTQNSTGATLCSWDAPEAVTLAAAPASGTNRYDLVVVQPRWNDLDGGSNNDFIVTNVTGAAAASPSVPAVPAGALALAQIYIPGGSASVVAGNITDRRPGGLSLASVGPAPAQATGSATITFSAATVSSTATVTFPAGRFTVAPTVMLVVSSTSYVWASIQTNPTATGFSFRGYATASTTGTFTVFWYATAAV